MIFASLIAQVSTDLSAGATYVPYDFALLNAAVAHERFSIAVFVSSCVAPVLSATACAVAIAQLYVSCAPVETFPISIPISCAANNITASDIAHVNADLSTYVPYAFALLNVEVAVAKSETPLSTSDCVAPVLSAIACAVAIAHVYAAITHESTR